MFRQIPNLGKELDKNHVGKELACGPSLPFLERVLRKRSHHLCPDRPSWTRELVASSTASYAKNVWLCPEHLHSQSLLKVNSVPRTTGSLGYFGIFFWGFYRSDISSPQDMPRMCSNFVFNTSRDQTLDLSSSRCPDQKSWRALEDESFRSSLASWFLTWGTRDSSADAEGSEGAKPLVSQGWRMVDRKTPNGFRIANGLSHPTYKVYKNMKNNRLKRQDHPWNGKHQQLEASHLATPSANSCKPWGQWNEQNKLYLCIWWFQAIPNMFWLVGIISNHHPNSLCLENTRPLKLKPPTRHWLLLISKLTLKSNCRPSQAFTHQNC